jgi:hypothetical protein
MPAIDDYYEEDWIRDGGELKHKRGFTQLRNQIKSDNNL